MHHARSHGRGVELGTARANTASTVFASTVIHEIIHQKAFMRSSVGQGERKVWERSAIPGGPECTGATTGLGKA